ncbi:unnamed protein product, partial [Tilletia controversa]
MAEHDVDDDVQEMFKAAHRTVFNHNLAESQRAALQKYYAWNRSTWCRRYRLIVNSGSTDPIFDLAVVDSADLDVYVREEETRARQEQKAKLAAMQAKMDQILAASSARSSDVYAPPTRNTNPPSSSSRYPKAKRHGERGSFRTEIAGVAGTARLYACARCGGRARHDVGRCDKTHFVKASCATYETITHRDKAEGPLVFKDSGTPVCLNFNEAGRSDGWHYGDEEIAALADDLGLPLHKPTPWSSIFAYAGYVFNILDRRAGLPASKVARYRGDLDFWLSSPTHRLDDAQRLLGRLLHASPIVLDASRHLTRLIGFINIAMRSNAHARAERHGGTALDEDVRWWRERLSGEEVWRSIAEYAPQDINLYVDASSDWGVGIWWN